MERVFKLEDGSILKVKLPAKCEEKTRKNWNFTRWKDFGKMLADETFVERLLAVLHDAILEGAAAIDPGFAEPIFVICDDQVARTSRHAKVVALDVRVRREEGVVEVLINKMYPCTEP